MFGNNRPKATSTIPVDTAAGLSPITEVPELQRLSYLIKSKVEDYESLTTALYDKVKFIKSFTRDSPEPSVLKELPECFSDDLENQIHLIEEYNERLRYIISHLNTLI